MNEAKVNTNIGDVSSPETKNPPKCVGATEPTLGGQSKPIFQHPERAPYELGCLLRRLPRHLHGASLDAVQLEQIEAADRHAANTTATLLDGLQSLGRVLWSAAVNEDFPAHVGDCARVGTLVTEIALQLEFLNGFREEVAEHNLRIAQAGPRAEARV
ncbi:hypothetical protein GPY61_31960 [Massilia sp. NEAU-DD11]|uniref:Uncharacterized protein n=1 Tax=Massilia cellulosiltytica TaxID=2683234 RepID=A0A7X3G6I0_9BURK|nr:hypothetical protein [Telluria cellulosilytica]MVW64538.1 hypothetical protein [Telluria cellulosilytica]